MPLQEGKSIPACSPGSSQLFLLIPLSPPPSPEAWLGTTPGSPRSGRGCSSPWLVKGRQELLVLCAALSVITAHCKGWGGGDSREPKKTKMGNKNSPDPIRNQNCCCWAAGKVISAVGQVTSSMFLGCTGPCLGAESLCASLHTCEHLCFRGQGQALGERGLASGFAAFGQESVALSA